MPKEQSGNKGYHVFRLSSLLFIVFFVAFLFSGYQIVSYFLESKEEGDLNQEMIHTAVVPSANSLVYVEDVITTEEPVTEEITTKKKILYYPDIAVDIQKIKSEYPGVVGWLYLPETKINYPVMQWDDNDYFVHRLPNGKENSAGSIFMDCRSAADLSQRNYILYGHNMKNNSMFGMVLEYRDPEFFEEHPYLFYFTESAKYRLEVFAGVHTKSDSDVYSFPQTDDEMWYYISKLRTNSVFKSEVKVSKNDRVFVLSTCSGSTSDDRRFVVCAKLVPIED